jgi:serine/threonine protein kinase
MLAEISHYRVEEQIGKGGMGVVFRAMDTRLNRPVALKFLSEESLKHEGARHRLLREARAASALNHGNIAMIHEIDDSDEHTFIAMEYVEGETIRDRIERGPLPTTEALNYAAQIADALSEAHSKRIVHRDIKASNVVIKPNGQIKVLDFGLAKFQAGDENTNENEASTVSTLTQSGTVIGTVAYMSPEQLRSQELDGRSDIFSLGVVLYEMVSGRKPFERANKIDSFGATLHEVPTPITEYVSDVPPSVIKLIEKCLEKNPKDRYQSSADLQKDLVKIKDEIDTGSMSVTDRLLRAIRTRGAWRALTAAVIVVVIASVSLAVYTIVEGGLPFLPTTARLSGINRIAVLPVRHLSKKNESSDLIAETLTDSLVASLTKTKRFTVLTARSTERYRDSNKDEKTIGQELQIDGLIETSVQENNGHLKVTTSLVRCKDGIAVWTDDVETFDNSLFSVQDRVSALIGNMVGEPEAKAIKIFENRPSLNQDAYAYYEQGKIFFNKLTRKDLDEAVNMYQRAIDIDPNFAYAYAGLSNSYAQYINLLEENDKSWLDKADVAANQALLLAPNLAEAHFARGRSHCIRYFEFNEGDPAQAKREIQESLDIRPEFAPALHAMTLIGLNDYLAYGDKTNLVQTLDYYQRANQLDPNFAATEKNVGLALAHLGRFDEAIDHVQRLRVTAPEYTEIYGTLASIYSLKGDNAQAVEQARKYLEHNPNDSFPHAILAVYLVKIGNRDEALAHLREAERLPNNRFYLDLYLTSAYAGLNDTAKALEHFRAYAKLADTKRYYARQQVRLLAEDSNYQSIRNNPEFQEIVNDLSK